MEKNKKIKNATPTEYKGIKYRSNLEARCAKVFEEYNINVEYEPTKIVLLPSFKYNGKTIRAITYTPDFVGDTFIIECKGYPNDRWRDKKKWIMHYLLKNGYDLTFYEVKSVKELKNLLEKIKKENEEAL